MNNEIKGIVDNEKCELKIIASEVLKKLLKDELDNKYPIKDNADIVSSLLYFINTN